MDTERDEIVKFEGFSFEDRLQKAIDKYDEKVRDWRKETGIQQREPIKIRRWFFLQIDDIVRWRIMNYAAGWFIVGLIIGAFLAPLVKTIIGWILLLICSSGWAMPTC